MFPFSMEVVLFLDSFSSWFLFIVILISSVIIVYSYFYISPYSKPVYFLVLTVLFVASMCLVVSMSRLFFLMLGWDGLGLVSFFLIVYYQNQSSIFSGIFTLLINRIGDAFFLCSISICLLFSSNLALLRRVVSHPMLLSLLVITFITKRAIYPFSPWLPMAMAAPTPISALVHSSTLVTSGLFLMIKFRYIFYSSLYLISCLAVLCLFTSFYAGMNTIFEKDLKKLIALSTLSHLGFIGLSFSLGLLSLSFFHLLAHALFKSLLFITIGDIIINLGHSQDIRFLSSGALYTPLSSFVISVSLLNLCGVPRLVGYFSKDLVLETSNYSYLGFVSYAVLMLNLVFTFYYTFQLFYYSFSFNKFRPYSIFSGPITLHSFLLCRLGLSSLGFGYFFLSLISPNLRFLAVPIALKLLPFSILFLFLLFIVTFLSQVTHHNQLANSYFSSMMFLYGFITKVSSRAYYSFAFGLVKTLELGAFNSFLNVKIPQSVSFIGLSIFRSSLFYPILYVGLSLFSFLLFV